MTVNNEKVTPEWSHIVDTDHISSTPIVRRFSASPQERKNIAQRLDVESIDHLEAEMTLERKSGNISILVTGVIKAKVMQLCVVSMEPVEEEIEETVEGWFTDSDAYVPLAKVRREKQSQGGEAEFEMMEEKDDPEKITDGELDLGEFVVQHLSLLINPYPHKDGTEYEVGDDTYKKPTKPSALRKNPFAALKALKNKKDDE